MTTDPYDWPFGEVYSSDPELENLAKAMQQSAEYQQGYRQSTANARAKGTANRLAAYKPANDVLTQLMGGQQQFDLDAMAAANPLTTTPGFGAQSSMGIGAQPTPKMQTEEGRAELYQDTVNANQNYGQGGGFADVAMSALTNPFTSPTGPIMYFADSDPMSATYRGDINMENAWNTARAAGYEPGVTVKPPNFPLSWPSEENLQWANLSPEQKAAAIERGEAERYVGYNGEGTYEPQLSPEEWNRLVTGE